MICFELRLNGRRLATAGIPGYGVLSSFVTWVKRNPRRTFATKRTELDLSLGGRFSDSDSSLGWVDLRLKVGDRIGWRIVDRPTCDPPKLSKEKPPLSAAENLKAGRRYLGRQKQQLAELERQIRKHELRVASGVRVLPPVVQGRAKMVCMEVKLNGRRLATAGIPGEATLGASLVWGWRPPEPEGRGELPAQELNLRLGGLESNSVYGTFLDWVSRELEVGDRVSVRILERTTADPPVTFRSGKTFNAIAKPRTFSPKAALRELGKQRASLEQEIREMQKHVARLER